MSQSAYRGNLARIATGAALAGLLSVPGIALGQSLKEQIVGAWQQVSIYNEEGGAKKHVYGDKPVGLTVFDRSGYYISYLSKPDLPIPQPNADLTSSCIKVIKAQMPNGMPITQQ